MLGSPRSGIRFGSRVIDSRLRPGIVVDDEVRCAIRLIRVGATYERAWASDLLEVDDAEFELAIMLRELSG